MNQRENGRREPGALGIWEHHETIHGILRNATGPEEARAALLDYLAEWEEVLLQGAFDLDRIEWAHALEAASILRTMVSPESEAVAGFSTMELLWGLARGSPDIGDGFAQEIDHLLRAIRGGSGLGEGWYGRDKAKGNEEEFPGSGRTAARRRSERLDRIGDELWRGIRRHPSGLDADLVAARTRNRAAILAYLGGSDTDWLSAPWQAAHVLHGHEGVETLRTLVALSGEDLAGLRLASHRGVPWGITPYYLSLFDFETHRRLRDGQIRAQVIPTMRMVRRMVEHRKGRERALDFMREADTSPIGRVTRRYPAVAIFKICDTCPQVCTYCQRNWLIKDAMDPEGIPTREALEEGIAWFAAHPAVTDVLLTGGDPLVHENQTLGWLLEALSRLEHVSSIRIGTRVPVTMPMRIDESTARLLGSFVSPGVRSIELMTHVQTASEVTEDLVASVDRLRRHRIPVYNQQVYTLETSRRFQTAATRVALRRSGIDPYYTFYAKGKEEHQDSLVPIARILQERKEEARLLPGVFRTDEPVFNVPGLGKHHLRGRQDRELIGLRTDGRRVYLFHPWEKGIAPVAPWAYVDVPIQGYLDRLRELGEDPEEYESIWYYY